MLLRGHNDPGGGFIGGLLAGIGFALYAIAHGTEAARRALRFEPQAIAMVGLGIALLAGLWAALFGDPLFTGQWWFYLVVVGAVLTLVLGLEEEI